MDSGKLNTRIVIKRLTKVDDGFGGTTSTKANAGTIWAYKEDLGGEFDVELTGLRRIYTDIELVVRKKTADDLIQKTDILSIEGSDKEYRINEMFDSTHKYFTTIRATTDD